MPFVITTRRRFSAAHQLRLYDGTMEDVHGHNWQVEVVVGAARLDVIGVVMDFHELERLIDVIIAPMQNRHLNDLTPFDLASKQGLNPSAENVALHIAQSLELPATVLLKRVRVWETDDSSAIYEP